ncbi:hypothetical protein QN277_001099 [Acacia crassicarpa]|uniref:Neoxanthin synthase n=1 Tax=Acacia crassicarpa TaxID=499986 RepID=A0AAE1THY4_9FABA|nr:hypothetical protein QN277_001099 [Acacia crassicarpa]
MAFSSSSSSVCYSPLTLKIGELGTVRSGGDFSRNRRVKLRGEWSFIGGSKITLKPSQVVPSLLCQKSTVVCASWLSSSELASNVFTLGSVAVLPYYTLMVIAPKAEITKKSMESGIPYVLLGLLYAYLLCLSWTPETLQLLFATQYFLPQLSSIAKMFSSDITLASAWIHLMLIDLFAARQVFLDGLKNQIETRHSVSLCLFCCPIGVLSHFITKQITKTAITETTRES